MKRNKQSKVVDVDKGLVIVRYATAADEIRPPKIEVLVNPKDQKHIEIISNPLHSEAVLWQPGALPCGPRHAARKIVRRGRSAR